MQSEKKINFVMNYVITALLLTCFIVMQRKHRKWLCFLSGLGITIAGVVALVIYLELRPS